LLQRCGDICHYPSAGMPGRHSIPPLSAGDSPQADAHGVFLWLASCAERAFTVTGCYSASNKAFARRGALAACGAARYCAWPRIILPLCFSSRRRLSPRGKVPPEHRFACAAAGDACGRRLLAEKWRDAWA